MPDETPMAEINKGSITLKWSLLLNIIIYIVSMFGFSEHLKDQIKSTSTEAKQEVSANRQVTKEAAASLEYRIEQLEEQQAILSTKIDKLIKASKRGNRE